MRCVRNSENLEIARGYWIWSDVPDNREGLNWGYYFENWEFPSEIENDLELLSNCCRSVFKPRESFLTEDIKIPKKLIGIHIRRGDSENLKLKKVQDVQKYVEIIKNYSPEEYCVYCSTDSPDKVFPILKESLSEYDIIFSKLSKSIPKVPMGMDIEMYCANNKGCIKNVVSSAIQDMHYLGKSEIFIGPLHDSVFSSFSSLLAHSNKKKVIDIVTGKESIELDRVKKIGLPF
jgi:hypothetical protein